MSLRSPFLPMLLAAGGCAGTAGPERPESPPDIILLVPTGLRAGAAEQALYGAWGAQPATAAVANGSAQEEWILTAVQTALIVLSESTKDVVVGCPTSTAAATTASRARARRRTVRSRSTPRAGPRTTVRPRRLVVRGFASRGRSKKCSTRAGAAARNAARATR